MNSCKRFIQCSLASAGLFFAMTGICDGVKISEECTKELYGPKGTHIVLVIGNDGSIDDVESPYMKLSAINFPLPVKFIGDGDGKDDTIIPRSITIVPYSNSPVRTMVCFWGAGGKYYCK